LIFASFHQGKEDAPQGQRTMQKLQRTENQATKLHLRYFSTINPITYYLNSYLSRDFHSRNGNLIKATRRKGLIYRQKQIWEK